MPEPSYQPDFDVDAAVHNYFAQRAGEPLPPPPPAGAATIDSGRAKWTAWLRTQPVAALDDWWTRFRAATADGAARAAATLQDWAAEVDIDALGLGPRQAVGWWLRLGDALGQPTAGAPPVWHQWRSIVCYEAALRRLNEAATGDPTAVDRDAL
ncbi:MAG TPA: hypothetical protein DCZ72_00380, partial [Armatimonadetes bacterium]|nr:hypothetical protein [Armatimonadota bacterium]